MTIAPAKRQWPVLLSLAVLSLTPLPTLALDTNGMTTAGDAACWVNPACSIPRGGDSDVMTVYSPLGPSGVRAIFAQIFAFGGEEANNRYYFDPTLVQGSLPTGAGSAYTTLWESDGSAWSDAFGVESGTAIPGVFVGFISDPQSPGNIPPTTFMVFEQAGLPNPVPEPNDNDSAYLTIEYNATSYLSAGMQAAGFTATFQSTTAGAAVSEPPTYATMLAGLVFVGTMARRRRSRT